WVQGALRFSLSLFGFDPRSTSAKTSREKEVPQDPGKRLIEWCLDRNPPKRKPLGMEKQPTHLEALSKKTIVSTIAISRVSDQWRAQMLEVAPDLMQTPGLCFDPHQRIPRTWVSTDCNRKLGGRDPLIHRARLKKSRAFLVFKRLIDSPLLYS